jgi:tRNA uridine 5-carboxymethylaminomethyl modification enzyme
MIEAESQRLRDTWIRPGQLSEAQMLAALGQALGRETTLAELLRRPEVTYADLMRLPGAGAAVTDPKVAEQVEIQARYSGYIERQHDEIARQRRHEETALPADLDFAQVKGLSAEVREKFERVRPATVGQAARIPGVTPAAVSLLLVYLKKHRGASERKRA